MNKILIVIYLGIKNLEKSQIQKYFSEMASNLPSKEDGFFSFLVPDKEGESIRIECLNPVLMQEIEYAAVREKLERLNEKLKADFNI